MNKANSRRQLDAIGTRRKALDEDSAKLHADTVVAVANAREAKIPMTEAARRIGLTRTTIYQVYMRGGSNAAAPGALAAATG